MYLLFVSHGSTGGVWNEFFYFLAGFTRSAARQCQFFPWMCSEAVSFPRLSFIDRLCSKRKFEVRSYYLNHKKYHTNLRLSSEPCSLLIFIQRTCRFQGHSLSFRYHFGRYVYFFTCDGHPSWTHLFARGFKYRISWEPQSKFLSKKISSFFQSVEFVNLT